MQTLGIEETYSVELGEIKKVIIILIGCGGTGSFLALHLARLAWYAREQHDLHIDLLFVDPDTVEEANIGRQNFAPVAEIGQNKALTLASRYSAAFGLPIYGYPIPVQELKRPNAFNQHVIYVGAVDNVEARAEIDEEHFCRRDGEKRRWWMDTGNHEDAAGQVLLGNSRNPEPVINPLGFCSHLPLPSVQAPDLVDTEGNTDDDEDDAGDESCAELVLRGTQTLMVNQMVADWAAQYLYRLLITRDLDIYATYFNLPGGKADSVSITGTPDKLT